MSAFIDGHRGRFGVEPICRTLGVSASAYYQRATGRRSARALEDERLLEVIRRTHKTNFEAYGYRKLWKTLRRAGETAPRCQVQRSMREHEIRGAKRRGKPWRTTIPDPSADRSPDVVERDFTAPAPDRLWVGDFTHLRYWEGKAYFSFVTDVFSRKIVGWQLASHMRTDLVLDALRMALGTRNPGADFQLIAHTDAGSQYTSHRYAQVIDDHHVLASIGSVGAQLNITGATANTPAGVAIDSCRRRALLGNNFTGTISYARLDVTGGGGQLNLRRDDGAGRPVRRAAGGPQRRRRAGDRGRVGSRFEALLFAGLMGQLARRPPGPRVATRTGPAAGRAATARAAPPSAQNRVGRRDDAPRERLTSPSANESASSTAGSGGRDAWNGRPAEARGALADCSIDQRAAILPVLARTPPPGQREPRISGLRSLISARGGAQV